MAYLLPVSTLSPTNIDCQSRFLPYTPLFDTAVMSADSVLFRIKRSIKIYYLSCYLMGTADL